MKARRVGLRAVRGQVGRHHHHAHETEGGFRGERRFEMTPVNRIERAAENADAPDGSCRRGACRRVLGLAFDRDAPPHGLEELGQARAGGGRDAQERQPERGSARRERRHAGLGSSVTASILFAATICGLAASAG